VSTRLTRFPAVSGTFYPGMARALVKSVEGYLREVGPPRKAKRPMPKALIAPHAGYVYSGPVAASAYAALEGCHDTIRRVVLLGPCHRVAVRGLATSGADFFETPLGDVRLDPVAREEALRLPHVKVDEEAHRLEHSLEVHLPFLQRMLGSFALVPFAVGDASDEEVAEVLDLLWGGPETLIVVSSDLSHYHDYATAKQMDSETTRAIESFEPEALDFESACGRVPVRGLLVCAKRRGLEVETVDLRSSGDTAGARDEVVGYGSWVFRPPARKIDPKARFDETLLDVARRSIEWGAASSGPLPVETETYPPALREVRSTFVTLKLDGELRGCIGSLEAARPLVSDVARSAYKAAYEDPRFPPVSAEERGRLEIHVSVLEPSKPMSFKSEGDLLAQLRPGVDGLILREGGSQATFLPDVWESLPEPRDFVAQLKKKAGLAADYWSPTVEVDRYTTRSIG
jgi:AmmeMemoRadiSam system protein B/AmmeMemoRadiSam system protein A